MTLQKLIAMIATAEVYFHYPAGSSPLRPMDVKKAQERRRVTPKPKGLVFNTLTNGLEELDEARIWASKSNCNWLKFKLRA